MYTAACYFPNGVHGVSLYVFFTIFPRIMYNPIPLVMTTISCSFFFLSFFTSLHVCNVCCSCILVLLLRTSLLYCAHSQH